MTTKMTSPEDAASASVDGVLYEPDADGVFTIDNGAHATILSGPPFHFQTQGGQEELTDEQKAAAAEALEQAAEQSRLEQERMAREAEEAEAKEAEEAAAAEALTAKIAELEALDFTKFQNRDKVAEWLHDNGVEDAKATEDRDALNTKADARRAALIGELKGESNS